MAKQELPAHTERATKITKFKTNKNRSRIRELYTHSLFLALRETQAASQTALLAGQCGRSPAARYW